MKVRSYVYFIIPFFLMTLLFTNHVIYGKEKKQKADPFDLPNHVLSITKENTFPNRSENKEVIEPSSLTQQLLEKTNVKIENPLLIKQLNETSLSPSPIAIGYRGNIYLGRWPLNYKSEQTTVNWEYERVNENELDNRSSDVPQEISYNQQKEYEVTGALTNKIEEADQIKKMMLYAAQEKTTLPLSFKTIIGANTKKENYYNVPAEKIGYLQAHVPAVNETGQVTYGEVYINLKGSQKSITIKNVTKQGIGAWIPIHDHLSFSFKLK